MAERKFIGWGAYMIDALGRVLPKPPPPHDTGYVPLTATALAEDPVVFCVCREYKNSPLFRLLIFIWISFMSMAIVWSIYDYFRGTGN
jgi:hypothetical protein